MTKQYRRLGTLLYVGNVMELRRIRVSSRQIDFGAAAALTDAFSVLEQHYPELREVLRRFASPPIRNAGTLGGNIANASPIGDSMPPLLALGARVVLRKGGARRILPLEDFYLAYQKTALQAGEFVERVQLPRRRPGLRLATYKISKRFDQDISAVCAAFAIELRDGAIRSARIAFGGLAATPKRAPGCEAALVGKPWNDAICEQAVAALAKDFAPISDMRASAAYRLKVAQNLLRKFRLETGGVLGKVPSRLYDLARVPG